ncbi:MAG: hypothetical protein ACRCZP_19900 [Phycicoccus sp.]
MIFGSPRQALAYLYAHHRGPTAARPKYHDAPGGTGRSHWDGTQVGAMLYGPRSAGCCGVERGGPLDERIRAWATSAHLQSCKGRGCDCLARTDDVLAVERKIRAILRQHSLLAERRRVAIPRVRHWKDPDNRVWAKAMRDRENSPCATVQVVAKLP